MVQIVPDTTLYGWPCSMVAVAGANGGQLIPVQTSKDDGYMTLRDMNTYVRQNLSVAKRTDYRRGERPLLKDLKVDGRAIVCVLGHYVFVEEDRYYSFYRNDNDEVVAIWFLK